MEKQYSVVTYLEDTPKDEIRLLQKNVSEVSGSYACIEAWEPHLTVGDGIVLSDDHLNNVEDIINGIMQNQLPFLVTLEGFGGKTTEKMVKEKLQHRMCSG